MLISFMSSTNFKVYRIRVSYSGGGKGGDPPLIEIPPNITEYALIISIIIAHFFPHTSTPTCILPSIQNSCITLYSKNMIKKENVDYGEFDYFKGNHLPYAIPAIFVLVFMGPLLLLSYPLCYKVLTLLGIQESRFTKFCARLYHWKNSSLSLIHFKALLKMSTVLYLYISSSVRLYVLFHA